MKQIKLGIRKVCSVNYSYAITLPKIWLENNNVKTNDYLELSMIPDGSLLIRPAKESRNDAEQVQ